MTQPQRPEGYEGSRNADTGKGGKKKPATEPTVPPAETAQKPLPEIVVDFVEADRPVESLARQGDLSAPADEDEYDDEDEQEGEHEDVMEGSLEEEFSTDTDKDNGSDYSEIADSKESESEEVDAEFIERAVDIANEFEDRKDQTRLEYAMWAFKTFFDGNIEAALTKDHGNKGKYARFLANKRLKTKPRRVSDLVRGAAIRTGLVARNLELPNLTFSHCLELVAIDDEAVRTRMAMEINEKELSVRDARKKILELNSRKVPKKLVEQLLHKIKDPRSLLVEGDYKKMIEDDEYITDELSKKERLNLRAELDTKRDQISACSQFLDLLEQRLSDIDL
jgi:hypothetical protein